MIPPVLLIGAGRMGQALLAAWRQLGLAPSVVVDPAPGAVALAGSDVTVVAEAAMIPAGFAPAAVLLAIKPQVAELVLPAYRERTQGALVVSVMAGRRIGPIAAGLGAKAVVRAMPNLAASLRQGVTALFAGPEVTSAQRELAASLFAAVGKIGWVEDEALLDPVTAISGSGPAYVFLLAELFEQAGAEQGLKPKLARTLARQTVIGAAAILATREEGAAALRQEVTSPGGTTERALAVLMAPDAWPVLVSRAVAAAAARARELAG